jgi:hypothetical protein
MRGGGGGEVVRQNLCDGRTQHTHTHTPRGGGGLVGWLAGRSLGYKGKKKFRGAYSAAARRPQLPPITQPTQTTHHSHQSPPPLPPPPRAFLCLALSPRRPPRALSRYRGNTTSLPAAFLACFTHTTSSSRSRGQCPPKHTGTAGRGRRRRRRTAGVIDLTKREKHTHTRTHLHICTRARTHPY